MGKPIIIDFANDPDTNVSTLKETTSITHLLQGVVILGFQ
jgi:hypothetical protein